MEIRSIKYWAIIVIITISITTMSLFGLLSYQNLSKSLIQQYENKAESSLNEINNAFHHHFSHIETILVQFSKSSSLITNYKEQFEYINASLQEYQKMLPPSSRIFFYVDENTKFYGSNHDIPSSFQLTKQPWYIEAKRQPNEIIWTEPYEDEFNGNVVISAARTVKDSSGKQGVVGIDFTLNSLNEDILKNGIGEEGLVFLLDKKGTVITNNQNILVGQPLFGDSHEELIKQTSKKHVPYIINNNTYYLHSREIEHSPLFVVSGISKNEINKNLIESHLDIFIVGVVCVLIFSTIVYLLTLWSIRPLKELGKLMSSVESGNYNVRARENSYIEIRRLARGFNNMLQAIKKRDQELLISNNELMEAKEKLKIEYEKLMESQRILKASEEKVQYLASHDTLTGLINRRSLLEEMSESIKNDKSGKFKVVFFMDLDNFKTINDSLGHSYGDLLLIEVANKLNSIPIEKKHVARISGDEFILVLHDIESFDQIEQFANKIVEQFEIPIKIGSKSLNITASIGIAIYPIHAKNAEDLLKIADMAMYRAKDSGKKGYRIFDESIKQEVETRLEIEQGIRECLKSNEFDIYFQPIYNTIYDKITSIEALLRIKSKALSKFSITEIINTAETTGQIVEIDKWMLKNACEAIKKINSFLKEKIRISINISAIHIMQQDFVKSISSIIKESGVEPSLIELEITETSVMKSFDLNKEKLNSLKGIGLSIHLDDFGTGYSSLSYLNKLPIDHLKIDKSFIDSMLQSEKGSRIVETIITLAHNIGFQVVAEGVEKEEQFNILKQYQCELIQGYYIHEPMDFDSLVTFLLEKSNESVNIVE